MVCFAPLARMLHGTCRLLAIRRTDRNMLALAVLIAGLTTPARAQPSQQNVAGIVRLQDGQPAADVEVTLQQMTVRTDADGAFKFEYPLQGIFGQSIVARNAAGDVQGYRFFMWQRTGNEAPPASIELTLEPAVTVRAQVVDGKSQSVPDVKVTLIADHSHAVSAVTDANGQAEIQIPAAARVRTMFARKSQLGFDYVTLINEQDFYNNPNLKVETPTEPVQLVLDGARTVEVRLVDGDGKPVAGTGIYPWLFRKHGNAGQQFNTAFVVSDFSVQTDSNGVAVFDWLPTWEKSSEFVFWPMLNNQHQYQQRGTFNMASGEDSLTIQIERGVMIGGIARKPGGEPAAGVSISIRGIGPDNNQFGNGTQTGADGRYQLEAPADSVCMLIVEDENWAAELKTDITVEKNSDLNDLNFDLRTPTKITGRVAVRASGRPAVNQSVSLEQSGMDTNSNPELRRSQGGNQYVPPLNHYRQTNTDADGRFEFKVGPGRYLLRGSRNAAQQQFTVQDEPALNFDFTVERPDRGPFTAQIDAGKTGAAVAGTTIEIRSENQWWTPEVAEADSAGKVAMERSLLRAFVHARSKDGKFGRIVAIDPDTETTTIELEACGELTGRLVHATSGKPLANAEFVYGIRPDLGITIYGGVSFAGASGKTDGDGRFTISNLVVNQNYDIDLQVQGQQFQSKSPLSVSATGTTDVGDVPAQPQAARQSQASIPPAQPGTIPAAPAISWSRILIMGNLIVVPLIAIGFFVWQRRTR